MFDSCWDETCYNSDFSCSKLTILILINGKMITVQNTIHCLPLTALCT